MSYARKSPESDVYVYSDGARYICHECRMMFDPEQDGPEPHVTRESATDMLEHLTDEHIQLGGHKVPVGALERLRAEDSRCDT